MTSPANHEPCRHLHGGRFCQAVEHRRAIRTLRVDQVAQEQRTGTRHVLFLLTWDLGLLKRRTHALRRRVRWLSLRPAPLPAIPHRASWLRLVGCEGAGYGWHANTGNGFYGGLQFTFTTWLGSGGGTFAPRADLATPLEQMQTAEVTLSRQGWGAWPACSRKLGLR